MGMTTLSIELFMDGPEAPYVIAPVDDMGRVEDAMPEGWCVGHSWWNSRPEDKQADGRWKLFLHLTASPCEACSRACTNHRDRPVVTRQLRTTESRIALAARQHLNMTGATR